MNQSCAFKVEMHDSVRRIVTAMIHSHRKGRAMAKFKYKGRTFSSGRSLTNAVTRDINRKIENKIRQAAAPSGAKVRKTHDGFEVTGNAAQLDRFHRRLIT